MKRPRRTGKGAKDIFAATSSTTAGEAAPAGPARGRAPAPEPWTKVTVVLFNRQIIELDRLATAIRAATGAAINRAELIRAVIDALLESGLDLTGATSEEDLKALVAKRLTR